MLLMIIVLFGCDQAAEIPEAKIAEPNYSKSGMILEAIDVETYTYMRLDMQGNEVWIASNPVNVSEGDVVKFSNAMLMKDFHSKVLGRNFESILFVTGVELVGATDEVSLGQVDSSNVVDPHEGLNIQAKANQQLADLAPIDVQPLEGGSTIATIFADHEQLEGKEVSLRAKVVKFSPNILGKNWITLQDGTGTATSNSLVVTSSESVNVGDELIVKGLIRINVDIGAGYTYQVILEESSFEQ